MIPSSHFTFLALKSFCHRCQIHVFLLWESYKLSFAALVDVLLFRLNLDKVRIALFLRNVSEAGVTPVTVCGVFLLAYRKFAKWWVIGKEVLFCKTYFSRFCFRI